MWFVLYLLPIYVFSLQIIAARFAMLFKWQQRRGIYTTKGETALSPFLMSVSCITVCPPHPCLDRVTLYLLGWSPLKYSPTEMIYFHLCCISAMQNEEAATWLVTLKKEQSNNLQTVIQIKPQSIIQSLHLCVQCHCLYIHRKKQRSARSYCSSSKYFNHRQ